MLCARIIDINKELGADLSESVNKIILISKDKAY